MQLGTALPFAKAAELLSQLGIQTNSTQIWRCCQAGAEALDEQKLLVPLKLQALQKQQSCAAKHYVMIDGSMLHIDGRWQEVKVARVFAQHDDRQKELDSSCYCAHIGHYSGFCQKLDTLLAHTKGELVFVSDGARWIRDYVSDRYQKAQQILDVYHVLEKLSAAAQQCGAESGWLEQQRQHLLSSSYGKLIHAVERLRWTDRNDFKKLRNYLLGNQYRMDYRSDKKQGLRIGSGPIESAHRSLLQQRMKLSGQRWKQQGATHMIKLRTAQANQLPKVAA